MTDKQEPPLNMQEQGQFVFLCVQFLESVLITGTQLQTFSAINNIHVHVNFHHALGQEKYTCMFGSYFSSRNVKFEFNSPNQILEYI